MALEAEPRRGSAPTSRPACTTRSGVPRRRRAPSARGRARGRRRGRAPPAAPRRPSARRRRPCRSRGRSRRAARRGTRRDAATAARRCVEPPALAPRARCAPLLLPGPARPPSRPRARELLAERLDRADLDLAGAPAARLTHVMPGQRRRLVRHEPEREQPLPSSGGLGAASRPTIRPSSSAAARATRSRVQATAAVDVAEPDPVHRGAQRAGVEEVVRRGRSCVEAGRGSRCTAVSSASSAQRRHARRYRATLP